MLLRRSKYRCEVGPKAAAEIKQRLSFPPPLSHLLSRPWRLYAMSCHALPSRTVPARQACLRSLHAILKHKWVRLDPRLKDMRRDLLTMLVSCSVGGTQVLCVTLCRFSLKKRKVER